MHNIKDFDFEELTALAREDLANQRVEHALAKLKLAYQMNSEAGEVAGLLAKIYAQLKLFDRAKTLFRQYLDKYPDALNERFQLGMVYLDSRDPQNAITIWEMLLEQDTTHPPALYYIATAQIETGRSGEAKRYLDILLKTAAPDNLYFNKAKELLAHIDNTGRHSSTSGERSAEINLNS